MPIERQGDFLVWPDSVGDGPMLGLESDRMDECVEEVHRRGYVGVFAAPTWGYRESDLDVMRRLPSLRSVWFTGMRLDNVEGLYAQADLRYLGIHGRRAAIDFGRFNGLRTVSTEWRGRDRGLAKQSGMHEYFLWHHKPKTKSFSNLETPASCRRVDFNWTNARSLAGLSGLVGTEWLEVHRSHNLESLSGIETLGDSLKKVIITTCGKLRDLSALDALPHLELAIVDGIRHRG